MMMTAAGTVSAARVFVMGVGVAGLQAIATARRLGAQVSATDVRSATREQISRWARSRSSSRTSRASRARARAAMPARSPEYQAAQAELVSAPYRQAGHRHHHRADPRPRRAAAGLGRADRDDARRLGDRRSRGGAGRQCRGRGRGRGGGAPRRQDRRPPQRARRASRRTRARCSPATSTISSSAFWDKEAGKPVLDDEIGDAIRLTQGGKVVNPRLLA